MGLTNPKMKISFKKLDMSDGYVAFVVSIVLIGALTAVLGDLSSHMGCTVGLKDSVTAIAFVALGTSIPGRPNPPPKTRNPADTENRNGTSLPAARYFRLKKQNKKKNE